MIVHTAWLVVPGRSLGHICLGEPNARVSSSLGKAAGGDAAMGRSWTTWVGKGGGRIDVYSTRKPDDRSVRPDVTVEVVRATSPRFRLANGLHPGSSSAALRRAFPLAQAQSFGSIATWDDVRAGLAWEIKHDRVSAVLIHRPGKPLNLSVGPYLGTPLLKN